MSVEEFTYTELKDIFTEQRTAGNCWENTRKKLHYGFTS